MQKKPKTQSLELSANHRGVISVRLRSLEESALHLLDLFRRPDSTLTLRPALPQERAAEVRRRVTELRGLISCVKLDLGMEHVELDDRREAVALLADMTVNVEELDAHDLKGYGSAPYELARDLRVWQMETLEIIEGIGRLVRSSHT